MAEALNSVMNLRVHKMQGVSLPGEGILAPQEGLCLMELVN
jgi:hypothetical protein